MKHIDENTQASASARRNRAFLGAGLFSVLLAFGAAVHARPDPIKPPPGATPPPSASPATGQPPPNDPQDPPPMPAPNGLPCTTGTDQRDCDPGHPGSPEGKRPGNTPPPAWFRDMAGRMFDLQESLEDMSEWARVNDPTVYYFSTWLMSVTQQYYALAYTPDGSPRPYAFGQMTRGDFNQIYYYWVRPIYFSLMDHAALYFQSHAASELGDYPDLISDVLSSYHPLVLCNYGFNGDDAGAREDLEAKTVEAKAGARR